MSGYTRWSPGLCQPLVTVNGRPRRGQSRTLRAGWPCASARSFGLFFIDGISGTHAASTRTFLAYTNGYYCLELLVPVVQWPFPTHRSAFSIIYVGDRRSPPHSLRYPSLPFICYALCTYAVVGRQLPNYSPSPSPLRLRSCLESELYYYCYPYVFACKPTLCC